MTIDQILDSWPLILATAGPVASIGAIYATFQHLRQDFSEHKSTTSEDFKDLAEHNAAEFRRSRAEFASEFIRIHDEMASVRDRLSKIEGICAARH